MDERKWRVLCQLAGRVLGEIAPSLQARIVFCGEKWTLEESMREALNRLEASHVSDFRIGTAGDLRAAVEAMYAFSADPPRIRSPKQAARELGIRVELLEPRLRMAFRRLRHSSYQPVPFRLFREGAPSPRLEKRRVEEELARALRRARMHANEAADHLSILIEDLREEGLQEALREVTRAGVHLGRAIERVRRRGSSS